MQTLDKPILSATAETTPKPFDIVALKRDTQIPFPEGIKCIPAGERGAVIDILSGGRLEVEFAEDPAFPHIISTDFAPDDLILISRG